MRRRVRKSVSQLLGFFGEGEGVCRTCACVWACLVCRGGGHTSELHGQLLRAGSCAGDGAQI